MVKIRWRSPSNFADLAPDGFKELLGALVFIYHQAHADGDLVVGGGTRTGKEGKWKFLHGTGNGGELPGEDR